MTFKNNQTSCSCDSQNYPLWDYLQFPIIKLISFLVSPFGKLLDALESGIWTCSIHFHFWTIWRKWYVLGINLWKCCMVLKFWRSVEPIKPASKWIFCAFLKSSSFKRTQKFISQLWATLLPTYIYDIMSSHFLMLSGAEYKEIAKTSFWRRPTKNNVLQNISR